MKILLDENLDWRLKRSLTGHQVESVSRNGWAGIKNGELLKRAADHFDVLVTMDQGIDHQQNLGGIRLIVVALQAKSNRLADTEPLIPHLLKALEKTVASGHLVIATP